jgi:hypothetical protein
MCKQRAKVLTDPAIATIKIADMPLKTAATHSDTKHKKYVCRRLSPEQETVILLLNIPARRGLNGDCW